MTAQKLSEAKRKLEDLEILKGSPVQPKNFNERRDKLEQEIFDLKISLYSQQIGDLEAMKARLISEHEKKFPPKDGKK